MCLQINDPTLPRLASILVASLLAAPGGVAADTPAPASGKAGVESGSDGNAVTAPKEACDLLMSGDSLIGTNNTDARANPPAHTPEQICATTKAIVASILRQSPAIKVLTLRIFPKGGDDEPGVGEGIFHSSAQAIEIARRAGELTAELADGKQVFWLDINHVFLRPDGSINSDLMPDPVHPNQAGAKAWAQAIEPTLAQLMGDQPIVDPLANPLRVPASGGGDGTYDWMQRHHSGLKVKSTKPQVVLLGDSITHHFGGIPTEGTPPSEQPVWDRLFPQTRPATNLGFGADRIPQVLWRLDHGTLDGMAPKRVVLMIGANDVLGGAEPPDAVVDGIRACPAGVNAAVSAVFID